MKNLNDVKYIPYDYRHASIPGGGFVTGFCFHPKEPNILYARTDIGGVYRYDYDENRWISLMDHVKATDRWESFPLSIALDPKEPDWLYVAAGDRKKNYLCRSKDCGKTFEYFIIPAEIHGNAPGRGTGERLIVDPGNTALIYFGSQTEGLLRSEDYGETWHKLPVAPEGGFPETDMSFVWLDSRSYRNGRCQTIVVSTSGRENSLGENIRGNCLYISRNAGKTFEPMPEQPDAEGYGKYPGFVGQRAAFSGNYLFITMSAVKNARLGWSGYACDSGGEEQGCILRYELTPQGDLLDVCYVTPELSALGGTAYRQGRRICEVTGFGGIGADESQPGRLVCSTQCSSLGDAVFYTEDYGRHWHPILHGLTIGRMDFRDVSYMKPEYNNQGNLIHWLSDIKIDPFHRDLAVFNTGTGVFMTKNLSSALTESPVVWKPTCRGIEETVHLNVYSPPAGEVRLIDIVGDLGGFAFTDLNNQSENSFADEKGHRYITCLNADYPDTNPMLVAVTSRGNWTGLTTGGIIWSTDQCKTWTRLPDPFGLTNRIDALIENIRMPNRNSGWVALSADAKTLVWCVGERYRLPVDAVVYTEDLGHSWKKVQVFDLDNRLILDSEMTMKVLSDREDPEVFYGFGNDSRMYISTDRARSFHQVKVPSEFPKLELGGMDGLMPAEIRAEAGETGIVWISTGEGGLWRIFYDKKDRKAAFCRVSKEGDSIYRQGMGAKAPDGLYSTLYVNGIIDGEYGFYRSLDEGRSWQRINASNQMYGDIRSITGDPRTFGRFYLATGSRGVLWGEPSQLN